MSFSIQASGLIISDKVRKRFRFSRKNVFDGVEYTTSKVLRKIPKSISVGGGLRKLGSGLADQSGKESVKGMSKIAEIQYAQMIINSVNSLASRNNGGIISVFCKNTRWYWADSSSFIKVHLYGGDSGEDFLKTISPGLEETGFSYLNVMRQIVFALSKYDTKLPDEATPHLDIELLR